MDCGKFHPNPQKSLLTKFRIFMVLHIQLSAYKVVLRSFFGGDIRTRLFAEVSSLFLDKRSRMANGLFLLIRLVCWCFGR
jgi:hypothetical protein